MQQEYLGTLLHMRPLKALMPGGCLHQPRISGELTHSYDMVNVAAYVRRTRAVFQPTNSNVVYRNPGKSTRFAISPNHLSRFSKLRAHNTDSCLKNLHTFVNVVL